jgi:hypothetical protein
MPVTWTKKLSFKREKQLMLIVDFSFIVSTYNKEQRKREHLKNLHKNVDETNHFNKQNNINSPTTN